MGNYRKILFFSLILSILNVSFLLGQETPKEEFKSAILSPIVRRTGDTVLRFEAGMFVPHVLYNLEEGGVAETNLSLGPDLGIGFDYYLDSNWRLGMMFNWDYGSSLNENDFHLLFFGVVGTYEFSFFRGYLTIPIRLSIGGSFPIAYDIYRSDFLIEPGTSILYHFNREFALSLSYSYSFNFQWVEAAGEDRAGGFQSIGLGLEYAF